MLQATPCWAQFNLQRKRFNSIVPWLLDRSRTLSETKFVGPSISKSSISFQLNSISRLLSMTSCCLPCLALPWPNLPQPDHAYSVPIPLPTAPQSSLVKSSLSEQHTQVCHILAWPNISYFCLVMITQKPFSYQLNPSSAQSSLPCVCQLGRFTIYQIGQIHPILAWPCLLSSHSPLPIVQHCPVYSMYGLVMFTIYQIGQIHPILAW